MRVLYVPSLPDLEPVPCLSCQGAGGFEGDHTEPCAACETCGGTGEVEACPNCRTVPTVQHGLEVCGCTVATVRDSMDACSFPQVGLLMRAAR